MRRPTVYIPIVLNLLILFLIMLVLNLQLFTRIAHESHAEQSLDDRHRASHVRPREAPGRSAGGLQVACRQVTLKPPSAMITPERKRPPPADGGLDHRGGAGCYSATIRSACAVRSMM